MLVYLGVRLRDCVSLFNRFNITLDQISQLSVACCEYFNLNAMFMQSSVNPTVWTLGHIVSARCANLFEKYGQGLGTVTMEGHEAKHIFLKKLSENTTYQNSWLEIFRHEFIMLISIGYLNKVTSSQELSVKMKPTYHREFLMIHLIVTVAF